MFNFSKKRWKAGKRPDLFVRVPVYNCLLPLLTLSPNTSNVPGALIPLALKPCLRRPLQAPAQTRGVLPGSGKHLLPQRGLPQCTGNAVRRENLGYVRGRTRPHVRCPRDPEGGSSEDPCTARVRQPRLTPGDEGLTEEPPGATTV